MERTKVILFGCGNTGKLIERYVFEHGGTLIAAVDHNAALVGTMLGHTVVSSDVDDSVIREADIAVISTGGGCVTQERNYPLLHQNSKIFWLLRDLDQLPTCGRPLSQRGRLDEMYNLRKPYYERFSDYMIDNNNTPEETISQIISKL